MHKLFCLLGALTLSACTSPFTPGAESTGEASAAVTTYADPTAVKAAADAGTCVPGAIIVGGEPQHPVLAAGVWSMAAEGDTISRGACMQIKASVILTAEDYDGEYENCLEGPAGILQLAEVNGSATLIDP